MVQFLGEAGHGRFQFLSESFLGTSGWIDCAFVGPGQSADKSPAIDPQPDSRGLLEGRQLDLVVGQALLKGDQAVAYYDTTGGSVGLQAGVQTYGYAMFFMNAKALQQLETADGFEVGVGPTVVVLDEGKAANLTTTTMKDDIYAFVFGQKGLMAGIGIQGNKITKINPK